MGASNAVNVTIAGQPGTLAVTPTTTVGTVNADGSVSMPDTGGLITFAGATNEPDGTTFTLNINGTPDPNTSPVTSSGGQVSIGWNAPASPTTSPVNDVITITF
jgi:hypothetical protein